jgi:hypothetical protein
MCWGRLGEICLWCSEADFPTTSTDEMEQRCCNSLQVSSKIYGVGLIYMICPTGFPQLLALLSITFLSVMYLAMLLEERIRQLCERITSCESEEETIQLTRELKDLLHQCIERLRKFEFRSSSSKN